MMQPALKILLAEHLALRGVLRVLQMDLNLLRRGAAVDAEIFSIIGDYIREFPNRIHHPKEEDVLFAAMRRRAPDRVGAVLDTLQREHQQEDAAIRDYLAALDDMLADRDGARDRFVHVASAYAQYLDRHIVVENTQAFPLAQQVLDDSDWQAINAAFRQNDDPLASGGDPDGKFAALHRRILALGAPPLGGG